MAAPAKTGGDTCFRYPEAALRALDEAPRRHRRRLAAILSAQPRHDRQHPMPGTVGPPSFNNRAERGATAFFPNLCRFRGLRSQHVEAPSYKPSAPENLFDFIGYSVRAHCPSAFGVRREITASLSVEHLAIGDLRH